MDRRLIAGIGAQVCRQAVVGRVQAHGCCETACGQRFDNGLLGGSMVDLDAVGCGLTGRSGD